MTVVLVGFATNWFERKKLCKFFEDSPEGFHYCCHSVLLCSNSRNLRERGENDRWEMTGSGSFTVCFNLRPVLHLDKLGHVIDQRSI